MMLSLTGLLAFAHTNNYSTLDASRDIVVVLLDGLYHYWIRQGAGGYLLVMTYSKDLTTEEGKSNG